jgi:TfoX/Sxy family transcriptional regulator of competence genes
MPYDHDLAERVRQSLAPRRDVVEKRMFGGVCFMVNGHMAVGVEKDRLMVRLEKDEARKALKQPFVAPMDFTGTVMRGFIFVGAGGVRTVPSVRKWVTRAVDFAAERKPRKKPKPKTKRKRARGASAARRTVTAVVRKPVAKPAAKPVAKPTAAKKASTGKPAPSRR